MTLREQYEAAKKRMHELGELAYGKPGKAKEQVEYTKARAEYRRLGEALRKSNEK